MLRFVDFEGSGYATKNSDYDTKILMIDLRTAVTHAGLTRDLITGDYDRICRRLRGGLPKTRIRRRTFPVSGTRLRAVVHEIDRTGWLQKSSNIARFTYKGHDFNFVVRDKFYTKEHYILAMRGRQRLADSAQLEAALLLCRVLGETHEAVFNRAHPAYDGFHVQFIRGATCAWSTDWPIAVARYSGEDVSRLSKRVFGRVQRLEKSGTPCDLIFRWKAKRYHLALIPRKAIQADKSLISLLQKPLGGLEMVGFFPVGREDADRMAEVRRFRRAPKDYIQALKAFAA